jgi:hypothetical protein
LADRGDSRPVIRRIGGRVDEKGDTHSPTKRS